MTDNAMGLTYGTRLSHFESPKFVGTERTVGNRWRVTGGVGWKRSGEDGRGVELKRIKKAAN